MTKIILEIKSQEDLQMLVSLLERLEINHWIDQEESPESTVEEREELYKIIDSGAPASDLNKKLEELEEGRQDRKLPYRED